MPASSKRKSARDFSEPDEVNALALRSGEGSAGQVNVVWVELDGHLGLIDPKVCIQGDPQNCVLAFTELTASIPTLTGTLKTGNGREYLFRGKGPSVLREASYDIAFERLMPPDRARLVAEHVHQDRESELSGSGPGVAPFEAGRAVVHHALVEFQRCGLFPSRNGDDALAGLGSMAFVHAKRRLNRHVAPVRSEVFVLHFDFLHRNTESGVQPAP